LKRDQDYYRYQRIRVIRRKTEILKFHGGNINVEAWTHGGQTGRLSKGKIHCSCPLCRSKSSDGLFHRDVKRQMKMEEH